MNREWHGGTADRGQATVELALALPMVCLLLLAMVQVAVIGRDQLAVQLAAREAAPPQSRHNRWAPASPPLTGPWPCGRSTC